MPATAGTSSVIGRDVLYRIRFEVDGSARAAGEQAAKIAEQSFERAERAKKKETAEHKKSLDQQIKHVEELVKKIDEVGREYEKANAKRRAADQQIVASSKQALEGVTQLGRSILLLGISSEKDLQKAIQAFAAFEAGVNLLKGTINVVEAATKAWGAYRAAVVAAGAANAAYGALSAGGRVAGGAAAGAVGDVARGAAGEVIGGAAVGVGGTVLAGKSAAVAEGAAALGTGIAATIKAIVVSPAFIIAGIAAGVKTIQEAITNRPGEGLVSGAVLSIPGYRSLAEAVGKGVLGTGDEATAQKQREFIFARNFQATQAEAQAGQDAIRDRFARQRFENRINALSFQANAAAGGGSAGSLAAVRTELGGLGGVGGPTGVALVERQVALRERERDLVRQIGQEQRQAATEQLRGLEQALKTQQQIAETLRGQLTGAAERFGQLSPAEQQRTILAQKKLTAGQALTQDERRRLRALGLDSTSAAVRGQDIADAERAGFSRFFGEDERRRLGAAQREEVRLSVAIERQRDFIVRLEADTEAEAEFLAREVSRLLVERDEQLRKQFADELRKFTDDFYGTRARDAQTAAALTP